MPTTDPTPDTTAGLKPHALGVLGIVFFVVAAAAPLAATLGTAPLTFGFVGVGAPGLYLAAAVVLLLWAVGYARMSRDVTSAAGFAAYIERGLGREAGFASATLAVFAYSLMLIGIYGALGFFTQSFVLDRFGLDWPWYVWTLLAAAAVAVLGYLDVNLSARVLGVLLIAEVSLLILFAVVVPARGGADGVTLSAFDPSNIFVAGFGVAIIFAAGSFVGFEATAIYGEEAKEPRRTVPRATYVAVTFIGVFYAAVMWAVGLAYPTSEVQEAALGDPANFVLAKNTEFVGQWSTDILVVLVVTSYFATVVAFHNVIARYVFSLGRGGTFPRVLGRTHPRFKSPYMASLLGSVVTVIVIAAFAIAGSDPFFVVFAWLTGAGTVGILALQALTALSVVVFFRRGTPQGSAWRTVIAPLLGGAGIVAFIVAALRNWSVLTGAVDGVGALLPWTLLLAAVIGIALSFVKRDVVSVTSGFRASGAIDRDGVLDRTEPPSRG